MKTLYPFLPSHHRALGRKNFLFAFTLGTLIGCMPPGNNADFISTNSKIYLKERAATTHPLDCRLQIHTPGEQKIVNMSVKNNPTAVFKVYQQLFQPAEESEDSWCNVRKSPVAKTKST